MSVLPKLMYKVSTSHIKISAESFVETDKLILKFIWIYISKGPRLAKNQDKTIKHCVSCYLHLKKWKTFIITFVWLLYLHMKGQGTDKTRCTHKPTIEPKRCYDLVLCFLSLLFSVRSRISLIMKNSQLFTYSRGPHLPLTLLRIKNRVGGSLFPHNLWKFFQSSNPVN